MKHPNVKSILEDIAQDVWQEPSLDKAKSIIRSRVEESRINDDSKHDILTAIDPIRSKPRLDQYLANSLLKYVGLSVNG